jgi:hypothetical protein
MRVAPRFARAILWLLASPAALMLATGGPASAASPITGTDVSTFSDTYPLEFPCQDEIYVVTEIGRAVVHFTYFEETGALHFHEFLQSKAVAVPLDRTGPTYTTSQIRASDSENIRAIRQGATLAETDTDSFRVVSHGSDGSNVFITFHAHFTVNANGETTVQLETDKTVCR